MNTNEFQTAKDIGDPSAIPNGPTWAALLSASLGAAAFGVLTDFSEVSKSAAKLLLWYRPSGSLSGVAGGAILIWAVAWIALHFMWTNKRFESQRLLTILVLVLAVSSLVTTFPPFYELFTHGG